jgi:hypothetical protein
MDFVGHIIKHVVDLTRSWQGRLIGIVVVAQLLIPVWYYSGASRDPHDERFAWRMFSPMRMTKCEPKFFRDDTLIDISAEFHEAWIEIAKRGRFHVIEEMGAALCEKYPKRAIKVTLDCTYLGGGIERYGGYNICDVPLL